MVATLEPLCTGKFGDCYVPRYLWRITHSKTFYRRQSEIPSICRWAVGGWIDLSMIDTLGYLISNHLLQEEYASNIRITSLTGSLLWALNYAHFLERQGFFKDIKLSLIDTTKISKGNIFPAACCIRRFDIEPQDIPWHDDPYHEYLVFYSLPDDAVISSIKLEDDGGEWNFRSSLNLLLPGYHRFSPLEERLHRSFERFQSPWYALPVSQTLIS
ncbi:hypothetical protein GGR57DRAFT_247165 [Xylariaceae sp. FL1272]|nr:hypothetical protein GGR57DRAFT_247165 [Xylariaceae sp. FL1272]